MIILLREVKMGSLLEDFKIGLVLSGGGAKDLMKQEFLKHYGN